MNQELFAKIAKIIDDKPHEFAMDSWENACNTTRCVAGWAVHLEIGESLYDSYGGLTGAVRALARRLDVPADVQWIAVELLDLDPILADELFFTDNDTARQAVDLFANGYVDEALQVLEV